MKKNNEVKKNNSKVISLLAIGGITLIVLAIILFSFPKIRSFLIGADRNKTKTANNWYDDVVEINSVTYNLNSLFSVFESHGWTLENEANRTLTARERGSETFKMNQADYRDGTLTLGIYNDSSSNADVSNCKVWSISVDNFLVDNPINFRLPGGITNGSTYSQIVSLYGPPEDDLTYTSTNTDLNYTMYHYSKDYIHYLDLAISNDDSIGLFYFSYRNLTE